jgi:peptidoglycan hydrolase-like protein with peptidoglycan-binding domain
MNKIHEQKIGRGNKPLKKIKTTTKTTTKTFTPVDTSRDEMCNGTKEVSEGMKGDIVGYIQAALSANLKINLNVDDEFGEETRNAVIKFQYDTKPQYNLTVTGKVDKATYFALMEGSSWACKTDVKKTTDVEKSTDVIKSTDVKPNEVKPVKVRKPMKDLDVVSPEKYKVRIKEQDDISQGIRNLKGIGGATSYKPATKSAAPPVNPEQILKRVINTGCIEALKKELNFELNGRPESQPRKFKDGSYAISGVNNENGEVIRLYYNGTGIRFKVDEENAMIPNTTENIEWECADFKKTTSLTADDNQMTDDQKDFVNSIVARGKGYYKTEMPSGYDEGQGAWKRIDLSTVKGGENLFKRNKFFVWAQTGVVGTKQDYVAKVAKFIRDSYYTFDEPDVTTPAYRTGVLLKDKFPDYKDYFQPNQMIWYVGPTYSGKEQEQVGSLVTDIVADAKLGGTKLKRKFCRGGVNVLFDAAENPTKNYFKNDSELQIVKDYVKRCVSKLAPNAVSDVLGGSRSKFDYLKSQRAGTEGSLRFMLGEQKNNLNTIIKKKLVEAKTKKENDFIEKKLIENRLKMIVESIKKQENIVEKKNLEKVSFEFINELKELGNQGLINENLGDTLKSIFGSGLETMPTTFFEIVFDKILNKLGLNDPTLKNELINLSKNNPNNIVSSFKDCESMTELIAKAITEILFMNLQSGKELKGQGWNLIRNILGQEIKKDEFLEKIKENLNDMVCQEFSTLTSNSQGLLSKIKGAIVK